MTPPEKEEDVPDVQLSFVFGNTVVRPQTNHVLPEDAEPQQPAEYYSTETLCLSRSELKHVPDSVLRNSTLKYLSLEGNQISSIPDSMFVSLPNLLWLDLRKNQIVSLPAEIGSHRSLKTLLLEGNPISELPPELGNVITLKGLNLRDCPIRFPPQDIVHQGVRSILHYLRSAMAMRPVSARKTPPELPVVEKLQLSELMGSSVEEPDESVDEDELEKFRELKHKLILLDKAELGSVGQRGKDVKSRLPITKRKKTTTKAAVIPELPLFDTQHRRKPEERRQAATRELKEKQVVLEQKKKSQEALQKWRTQAKMSELKQKKHERQRKREEAEADVKSASEDSGCAPQGQTLGKSIQECEEDSSARKLEQQIRARVEKIQGRRRNPTGTTNEQMAAAKEDVEEMRRLQTCLLERKGNRGRDLKNSFTIFTADTWPGFIDE